MFDTTDWCSSGMYPSLVAVDRPVMVDGLQAFFGAGGGLMSGVPLGVRSGGLRVEPWMPGRQHLWLRVRDGSWLAGVELEAHSGNGTSHLRMQLWLPPKAFILDADHRP
ncbi:hypothetical protein [Mycobacteroides chelonae]|uniref:Uncharacterized protein n=1 Tax=Mycobacteroides chelonae TaxID=1774 RepID=A0A1S1M0Q3_MYCCH|nr:hypothetical protein [Mycobacteroides chelonae]OHU76133.1 hypothetical protein BKG84_24895 [Mycobacteroides chelonae]